VCDPGAPLFAAMLGALEAGRFYVPLDPGLPVARLEAILRSLDAAAIVSGDAWSDLARGLAVSEPVLPIAELDAGPPAPEPATPVSPDDLAYVLFTSGSTGAPKGVMQSHRNLLHNAWKLARGLALRADDRLTLLSSPSFGASVSGIYGALLTGACVCPYSLAGDGLRRLPEFLTRERITVLHSVPSVFRCFSWTLDGREDLSALRVVKLGGEAVLASDFDLYRNRFPRRCVFHVGLGATEMHVIRQWFADHDTPWPGASPLGYAVDGTEVVLLDDAGRPAQDEGEIAVLARTLAVGYWKDPEGTAAAFVPVPGRPGVRMFRTGDLGRMLPDGCLLYVGRRGSRLKIRGHRVEVGEVENALLKVPGIREAVVDALGRAERPRLVAWIAREGGSLPSVEAVRAALSGALPAYMVPGELVFLERLPRTASGKVDRQALPDPDVDRPPSPAAAFEAGQRPVETEVAGIFARALGREGATTSSRSEGTRFRPSRSSSPSPNDSASSSPPRTCSKRRRPRRSPGGSPRGARSRRTPSCASSRRARPPFSSFREERATARISSSPGAWRA
jgi:amino acid adenylation domain-containing protein